MIYFGCWGQPGHYFHQSGSYGPRSASRAVCQSLPWTDVECDGNLQPGTAELEKRYEGERPRSQVEGVCRLHHRQGWTAMAFWDRSGDRRGNSCSVVMVEGTHDFANMMEMFEREFPSIYARCTTKFRLVEEKTRG